jgi:hypothetical protein
LADDHERWKKITQGDAAAYDAFYRETAPRLRLFLRQLVGSHEGTLTFGAKMGWEVSPGLFY